MKYFFFIITIISLASCDKVEDHYRISGMTIQVGQVSSGPNNQCINIGTETDSVYRDLFAIQFEFIREYYSTDSSRSSGVTYSPKGWEGCVEKISSLSLTSQSTQLNNLLFGDHSITSVNKLESMPCQMTHGCECKNALSFNSLDSLTLLFNNQHISQSRLFISEKYDETPFVFFLHKKDILHLIGQKINVKLEMSDGTILTATSNEIRLQEM